MAGLELIKLGKAFRKEQVLADLSLSATEGETIVVFGPSGTGKTVLLRLIAGIDDPDDGDIRLDGASLLGLAPEARGVGMAFQNFALYPHMAAFENIASPLRARARDGNGVAGKVDAIARLLKIDHVLDHQPRALSNGQKQRTALARALVAGPKILLLDDPLRNVDAKLRYEMRLELPRLLREFGSTVLYVTQDYKEAMALGDRIAVLLGGGIAQLASPEEIYDAPASVEVARLFGDPTINLLPSEVSKVDGQITVAVAGQGIALDPGFAEAAGRSVTLGLRPERIAVSEQNAPDVLPVELAAITPLNERVVMLLHLADGQELLASAPEEAVGGTRRHGPAFISFDPSDLLLFDRQSGRRIAQAGETP